MKLVKKRIIEVTYEMPDDEDVDLDDELDEDPEAEFDEEAEDVSDVPAPRAPLKKSARR
jgi:hypothetical protein